MTICKYRTIWSRARQWTDTSPQRTRHIVPDTDLFEGYKFSRYLSYKNTSVTNVLIMKVKYWNVLLMVIWGRNKNW